MSSHLTPTQRRQMQKLANSIDCATQTDGRFFNDANDAAEGQRIMGRLNTLSKITGAFVMRHAAHQRDRSYAPRGMRVEAAPDWMGIGTTKFLEMVADGRMPSGTLVDGSSSELAALKTSLRLAEVLFSQSQGAL